MRLRACIGLLAIVVGGCAHIPDHIRVDIDGNSIELIKKPPVAPTDPTPVKDEE